MVIRSCMTLLAITAAAGAAADDNATLAAPPAVTMEWLTDYHPAYQQAEMEHRSLLIWFVDSSREATPPAWGAWDDPEIRSRLARYVPLRVATTATFEFAGEPTVLLKHFSFAELHGQPGLAIVDLSDPKSRYFRQVVSVYPRSPSQKATASELSVLLDLPSGSLTQRTLIFAVRTHPESPRSTTGNPLPLLAAEAESHATHQASIQLQGHHNWDQRFYRINDQLPGQMVATEVCAESWPGETLLEAARDCVHSWRQSSGHWDAVRRPHRVFGYDMKRGGNGIWYATGIFGDDR